VVTVRQPRLVERRQDIPLLVDHILNLHAKRHHNKVKSVSSAARRRLLAYDWPGNVRELKNAVESMVVVDLDGVLDLDDLPEQFSATPEGGDAAAVGAGAALADLVGKTMSELEGMFLAETLKVTGGNREEAAGMLGIGERTLYRKIKEYGLN
ncbi:MAG: helix-turn-helix domain-containing protein, partial [Planctomycetota bacterium]